MNERKCWKCEAVNVVDKPNPENGWRCWKCLCQNDGSATGAGSIPNGKPKE